MFTLRAPCRHCGSIEGRIQPSNGQDCAYCSSCGLFQYNAPRTETGRAPRSVQSTHEAILPSQRARILQRATGRCELCGSPRELSVGHLLSVADGHAAGLPDGVINHDENLAAFCAECHLGMGRESIPVRLLVALLECRVRRSMDAAHRS